jgi:hypothetical protein
LIFDSSSPSSSMWSSPMRNCCLSQPIIV